jgi:hypothetical protein
MRISQSSIDSYRKSGIWWRRWVAGRITSAGGSSSLSAHRSVGSKRLPRSRGSSEGASLTANVYRGVFLRASSHHVDDDHVRRIRNARLRKTVSRLEYGPASRNEAALQGRQGLCASCRSGTSAGSRSPRMCQCIEPPLLQQSHRSLSKPRNASSGSLAYAVSALRRPQAPVQSTTWAL